MYPKSKIKIQNSKPQLKTQKFSKIVLFLSFTFCTLHFAFASEVPRFYGEEVVVTALRVPRLKSSLPWGTEIITREDIEDSTVVKLGDLLRGRAGVLIKADRGLSSQLSTSVRGSTAQQVLVLLDGSRINSPTLGSFDLGSLLLADIERIEIVKSPLSALYGADAVGGVINIITRKASQEHQYDLVASYGTFSTYNLSLSGSGPHYSFSAATLGSAGFIDNNDYRGQDLSLRLSRDVGKLYVEAGLKQYNADKGVANTTALARMTDTNTFYDLKVRAGELGFKATLSHAVLDQSYNNSTWGISSTHRTLSTIFDAQKTFALGSNQNYVLGAETRVDNSQSTDSGTQVLNNNAIYIQDEISFGDRTHIVLGARQDYNPVYGNYFNPRIGAVFNPAQNILFKVSWGSSFRAPTINDLYWTSSTYPTWAGGVGTTEGNTSLKSETGQSLDLTLQRNLGQQSLVRLTYFLSTVNNLIRWANTSSSSTDEYWTPSNVANASIQGVEFEYNKSILESLDAFMNFTYQDARDISTDNFLTYRPQTQINTGLTYHNPGGIKSNLLIKNIGEQYTNTANTSKLEPYTIVDLMLSKKLGKWRLKFDAENLFNTTYMETASSPMPGRRYKIGLGYKT